MNAEEARTARQMLNDGVAGLPADLRSRIMHAIDVLPIGGDRPSYLAAGIAITSSAVDAHCEQLVRERDGWNRVATQRAAQLIHESDCIH